MIPPPGCVCDLKKIECCWCHKKMVPGVTPDVGVILTCGCGRQSEIVQITRRLDRVVGNILSTVILRGKENEDA